MTSDRRYRITIRCRLVARGTGAALLGVLAVVLVAAPAGAHTGGPVHGLADGALHPLTGIDHLLAMVAVGCIAAVTVGGRRPWTIVIAFLGGMVVGGALGLSGVAFPGVETAIVVSVVGLGLAVALAPRADAPWLLALVAAAGLAHGNAHGIEAPTAGNPLLYVLGFVSVTAALHAVGAFGGVTVRRVPMARIGVGAGVATVGVLLLG
jgi:urease accessory protein